MELRCWMALMNHCAEDSCSQVCLADLSRYYSAWHLHHSNPELADIKIRRTCLYRVNFQFISWSSTIKSGRRRIDAGIEPSLMECLQMYNITRTT